MIYDEYGVLIEVDKSDEVVACKIKGYAANMFWEDVLKNKAEYCQEGFCIVGYCNAQLKEYRECYLTPDGINPFREDFRGCGWFEDGFGWVWEDVENDYFIDYSGDKFSKEEIDEYWKKYGGFGSDELKKHLEEKLKLAQKKEEE